MNNSKFINLLKTFSMDEIKDFQRFTSSSYFSKRKSNQKILKTIISFHPDYGSVKLTPEYIYQKVYPGKKYNERVIKSRLTDLFQIAEEYLAILNFRNDKFRYGYHYLAELKERNLDGLFRKNLLELESLLKKDNFMNSRYIYDTYLLENLKSNYLIRIGKSSRVFDSTIKASEFLTAYMLNQSSLLINSMAASKVNFNKDTGLEILESITKNLEFDNNFEELTENAADATIATLLKINYYTFRMTKDQGGIKYFYKLSEYIESNRELFNFGDLSSLYLVMLGYCSIQINNNNSEFRKEQFEIFKKMSRDGVLVAEGQNYIEPNLFRGIIVLGISLNEIEWIENFVEANIKAIEPGSRENLLYYSRAVILFEKEMYVDALKCSSKVISTKPIYKLDIKDLVLKSYYELKEYNAVAEHLDAYSHFVSLNKEVSSIMKKAHSNLIKFVKKLLKQQYLTVANAGDKFVLEMLKKSISSCVHLKSRKWLLAKVDELLI
jgi:hypothetical protein